MTVEFNAIVRDKGLGNDDKKKILLEVPISELKGKVEELTQFANKVVTIQIIPQHYSYTVPFDNSVNEPTMKYKVYEDGTVQLVQQEQTQLDVDGKGNVDIVQKSFSVDKDVIDDYILNTGSIKFRGEINPREVLQQLAEGVSMKEIADELEFSESALINELEHARRELAPFADAWKKANEKGELLPVNDTKVVEDDTKTQGSNTETEENVTDSEENDTEKAGDTDGEGDPY